MTWDTHFSAVVIGAGPAGLATSHELSERGVEHVVLERGAVGESWSKVYESLTRHTGKHMSALPGQKFSRRDPLFVSGPDFLSYLRRYQEHFRLPVKTGVTVTRAHRGDSGWTIETTGGIFTAEAIVIAAGIMATPVVPALEGQQDYRGLIRHSSSYRRPDECKGRRVLVIGAGNSAGEIASELGRAGIDTTVAVRSGANVVPLKIAGVPIQYISYLTRKLPRGVQEMIVAAMNRVTDAVRGKPVIPRPSHSALDAIPMIGFRLTDAIREGKVKLRGGVARLTPTGALFQSGEEEPFEEIILATGFRATVGFLGSQIRVDERGFASRRDRVVSTDQPGLFFVGHNYDSTGGLFNIRRDAPLAAEALTAWLAPRSDRTPPAPSET